MHHVHHVGEGEEGPGAEEGPGGGRRGLTPSASSLQGLRVAVTRPRDPGDRLTTLLEERGARPLLRPTTALAPPRDPGPLLSAARRIASYDWIVVTSRNAVQPLIRALEEAGTARSVQRERGDRSTGVDPGLRPRICAVGPGTAGALAEAGLPMDRMPERYVAEGVVEVLAPEVQGARERRSAGEPPGVLYPRAEGARDVIPRGLERMGARVDAVDAYRTVPDRAGARTLADGVDRGEVDVITFAASSAARSFARAWKEGGEGAEPTREWPGRVGVVAIGPVTARTLEEEGIPVHGIGEPHTLEGLVAAVEAWAREREA